MTRRLIQLYSALLYNAHLKGFAEGQIYTGPPSMWWGCCSCSGCCWDG